MEVKEASATYTDKSELSDVVTSGCDQLGEEVFPRDWVSHSITELASRHANAIVGGPFGSDLVSKDYVSVGVPVIRGQNMSRHYVAGDFVFVSKAKARQLQANLARPDDIVFTQRGTLGQVALVPATPFDEYVVSQSQMKLTLKPDIASAEYVYQYFVSDAGQKQILESAIQTGVPHTNLSILRRYQIPVPPTKAEQEAIATALSDADALIESLQQLIVKKGQIKQGTMQALLAGKRRLPGFDQPWKEMLIGELGSFLKGRGVSRDQATSGDLACIRYGEIYTKHDDYIKEFKSWISKDVASFATRLVHGDLLFAGSGETKEEIGKCVAFVGIEDAYAGSDIVILRGTGNDPKFLGYYLNTAAICARKASKGQGDAVVHISAEALGSIEIEIPEYEEQCAIAAILTDMDTELSELDARLTKTRQLKQGMMQELLTGRIRLV
jgi:type I restriction enzyme S subunit